MKCSLCEKHRDLSQYTAEPIAELGGWLMTHFPILPGEVCVRGHLLIETRRHITELSDMNATEAEALGQLICQGARVIKEELGVDHVYSFRINDKVPHLHFHLVPRHTQTPREFWGLQIMNYPQAPKVDWSEMVAVADRLRRAYR